MGEWSPPGRAPDGGPWRPGLASPRASRALLALLQADGRAVAVSSGATLRFGPGDRDHHIPDPRTGSSPPAFPAVAVAAPTDTLDHMFDRFYRADGARHGSGGHAGLGLAIVRAVAMMHGGTVFARCADVRVQVGLWLP